MVPQLKPKNPSCQKPKQATARRAAAREEAKVKTIVKRGRTYRNQYRICGAHSDGGHHKMPRDNASH